MKQRNIVKKHTFSFNKPKIEEDKRRKLKEKAERKEKDIQ